MISRLRKRWTKTLVLQAEAALDSPTSTLDDQATPFGSHIVDGRELVDLRGLTFTKVFLDKSLSQIDFGGVVWEPICGIGRSSFHACNFRGARLNGALSRHFETCDFSQSHLIDTRVGPGVDFQLCDFRETAFKRGLLVAATFDQCIFQKATFAKCDFLECAFQKCTFENCLFSNCSFGNSTFRQMNGAYRYLRAEKDLRISVELQMDADTFNDFGDSLMGGVQFL